MRPPDRGVAAVMAADIAPAPVTGLMVQACGDMHVSNFGVYASAERSLVFGINDFDETFPGPWEWDLERLAASAAVVARFLGGKDDAAADAARDITKSYRQHIRKYSRMGYLETWHAMIGEKVMAKARQRTNSQVLEALAKATKSRRIKVARASA